MKIILISRSLQKLQKVAKEIEDEFKVETAVIDVDFTSDLHIYDKIKENIAAKCVGVLVNNVGMAFPAPDYFHLIPNREKVIEDIVKCNVMTTPMMCSIVLPQMVKRKRGIIINVSSAAVLFPTPQLTVYSASKSFVSKFSEDLSAEYKKQGIIVQSLIPGPVAMTNMSKINKTSALIPSPKDFVSSALRTVGFSEVTTGFWSHSTLKIFSELFNFFMPATFLDHQLKLYGKFRQREIKLREYASAELD
jgi:17beta-estradiol 17-dehydrogenase / very-long-chain 3-oxoacyl-CoA reductase